MGNPAQTSNAGTSGAWPKPQSSSSVLHRQGVSFLIMILLWTAATPFSPISWFFSFMGGAFLFDRFMAGPILIAALYFQFRLASLSHPAVITIPNPLGQSETYIRDSRIKTETPEFVFVYDPRKYHVYAAVEVALLLVAEFGGFEYVRRAIVLGVLAALWAGGWCVTPRSTKQWAWKHVKRLWFWIVLDVMGDVYSGGRRRARSRY